MFPCSLIPHPGAQALCWASKAESAVRWSAQLITWSSRYYDLSNDVAKTVCLGAVIGISSYDVDITQDVNWLTTGEGSFTKIFIDASNMK